MSTLTVSKLFDARLNTRTVCGFAMATALGVFLAAYPLACLGAIALGVTVYALFRWCRAHMEWWQMLVVLALTPSLILNYGFDNFAVGAGGFKFPLSDVLMFLALILVAWRYGQEAIKNILLDPPAICLIALLVMTFFHLIFNIPRYGFYSVRDSSMFFESVILILGVMWAQSPRSTEFLKLWLFYALLINLIYSYTFIWGDQIQYMSPKFGVFHPVPLLGNYQQTSLWLLLGVIYFLWIAPQVVRWPRWILTLLAAAQLGGLAILQARSMYVGIGVILLVLFLFGETRKLVGFASTIGWGAGALLALLLTVSALGIQLQGRMGPVTFAFVEEQVETVFAMGNANTRMSHEADRADWYGEVWGRVTSSAANMAVGEGFGQALISFVNDEGIPVREPHNSSLTVLARLGFVGLSIWLLFIGMIVARYVRFLRIRSASPEAHVTVLWLFLCFLLYLLVASVQPTLEFSHGSMPFYFLVGLSIGIIGQKKYSFVPQSIGARDPRTVDA